jgi:hypothetical protein
VARNQGQFQSTVQFQRLFGMEERRRAAVVRMLSRDGFLYRVLRAFGLS